MRIQWQEFTLKHSRKMILFMYLQKIISLSMSIIKSKDSTKFFLRQLNPLCLYLSMWISFEMFKHAVFIWQREVTEAHFCFLDITWSTYCRSLHQPKRPWSLHPHSKKNLLTFDQSTSKGPVCVIKNFWFVLWIYVQIFLFWCSSF